VCSRLDRLGLSGSPCSGAGLGEWWGFAAVGGDRRLGWVALGCHPLEAGGRCQRPFLAGSCWKTSMGVRKAPGVRSRLLRAARCLRKSHRPWLSPMGRPLHHTPIQGEETFDSPRCSAWSSKTQACVRLRIRSHQFSASVTNRDASGQPIDSTPQMVGAATKNCWWNGIRRCRPSRTPIPERGSGQLSRDDRLS